MIKRKNFILKTTSLKLEKKKEKNALIESERKLRQNLEIIPKNETFFFFSFLMKKQAKKMKYKSLTR